MSLRWLLLLGVLAGASACVPAVAPERVATPVVWPEAPEPPRLRLVETLPAPGAAERSWWGRLWRVIVGLPPRDEVGVELQRPHGVAVAGAVLWIADPDAGVVWRLDRTAGDLAPVACDGPLALVSPVSVAVTDGGVLVADPESGRIVALSPDGACAFAMGESWLDRPTGVAWDAARRQVVVADAGLHRVLVLTPDGSLVRVIGGRGTAAGAFNYPTHVTVSPAGDILVVDAMNFAVQRFAGDTGAFLGRFGAPGRGAGWFSKPKGIAVDADGGVYVADAMQDQVFLFDLEGELLLAFGETGAPATRLSMPTGVAIGADARIYVADSLNRRVRVYERVQPAVAEVRR